MEWSEALATGHADIDEQHQELLQCFSELKTATTEQRFLLSAHCIAKLKRYARNHFVTEEAVMRACDFPRLQAHIASHEEFRSRLRELEEKSIGTDVSAEMVDFLSNWLLNHIAHADQEYVPYLKAR